MSKLTPGPWAVREMRNEDCELDRWIVDHAETKIAICEQWNEPCTAESDANATAIAAVPELVAALQLAQEKLSFYNGEYKGGPHIKAVNDAISAALTKAGAV